MAGNILRRPRSSRVRRHRRSLPWPAPDVQARRACGPRIRPTEPPGPRHFVRDWDAAPRKREYHQVVSVGEVLQLTGQDSSSVSSIGKPQRLHGLPWNSHVCQRCNQSALNISFGTRHGTRLPGRRIAKSSAANSRAGIFRATQEVARDIRELPSRRDASRGLLRGPRARRRALEDEWRALAAEPRHIACSPR